MYDIVGSLPLELLIYVAEYLSLEDIVRNQRVSKRWHTIFTCSAIIAPVLRETLAFLDLEREVVGTNVPIADAMRYLRWRHGLQHARPVRKIFFPWPAHWSIIPASVRCHSRRLCYPIAGSDNFEFLNLETGERSVWFDSERESCYFQYKMSGRYLVLQALRGPTKGTERFTALDMHTKQTCSQQIPLPCYEVVGDKAVYTSLPELTVQQTKWATCTGQLLERKILQLPLPPDVRIKDAADRDQYRTYGHKTVKQFFTSKDKLVIIHLEYNYAADRLNVRKIDCAESTNEKTKFSITSHADLSGQLAYHYIKDTRDIVIQDATAGKATLHPVLASRNDVIQAPTSPDFKPQRWGARNTFSPVYSAAFGDREVFGLVNRASVQLWFFNPNFTPDPRNWKLWNEG
ncbi:hypothetical protein VTN49DRAFT_1608 [Thermomyces lanuginosus]|uniref:uncharacterized protein n=1 Tax=Thermomyces lanuginosus TaxID=5541 RepID=UPI003742679E